MSKEKEEKPPKTDLPKDKVDLNNKTPYRTTSATNQKK